jgi:hypothetical protein
VNKKHNEAEPRLEDRGQASLGELGQRATMQERVKRKKMHGGSELLWENYFLERSRELPTYPGRWG